MPISTLSVDVALKINPFPIVQAELPEPPAPQAEPVVVNSPPVEACTQLPEVRFWSVRVSTVVLARVVVAKLAGNPTNKPVELLQVKLAFPAPSLAIPPNNI